MAKSDIIIRIGGDTALGGVISTGENFTAAAAHLGYRVFTFRSYPAEIKGGHAWFQVRISDQPVLSIGDGCDVLVAFDQEAYDLHKGVLNEGGVLVYDPNFVHPEDGKYVRYPVPFQRIAREELKFVRGTNVLVQGVMAGLFGLPPSSLEQEVRTRYQRRAEFLEKNLEALHYGYQYTKAIRKEDPFYLASADNVSRLVMSGNDAIVAGALYAGCRFFAGYPITPASDIMETMAKELPPLGGICLQAEDEMAALAAVIGASYTGAKAMTATSGPGFSLMTELMGLASMTEVPVVIVDAQRSGPSTGMPTKLEQGDLFQALYAGHGDFPRIVIAPGSVEDCLYQIVRAFNMAEKYQMPVIFLSDQSLSHRTESLDVPDLSSLPEVAQRERASLAGRNGYSRYALTPSGVSPVAVPGADRQGNYIAPGLEHDELGHPDLAPEVHEAMTQKRFRKLETAAREDAEELRRHGAQKALVGVISWGATEGSVREAVDRAVAQGYPVAAAHPRTLSPLPAEQIAEFASSVRHVIVPEVNYQGQFAHHLSATLGIRPIRLNKYGGLPFTPGEIFSKIEEVLQNER